MVHWNWGKGNASGSRSRLIVVTPPPSTTVTVGMSRKIGGSETSKGNIEFWFQSVNIIHNRIILKVGQTNHTVGTGSGHLL